MKLYALVTDQRTAAAETALCADHFQEEECRARALQQADSDVIALWEDCSENEALACIICGESAIEWGEADEGCPGHPSGPHDPMGETVYCDGSCS